MQYSTPSALALTATSIVRYAQDGQVPAQDLLATEAPLEIAIAQGPTLPETLTITMRTPGNDRELAQGFLFAEGILTNKEQVLEILQNSSEKITLWLREDVFLGKNILDRNFLTNSSCGVCGKNSLDFMKVQPQFRPTAARFSVSPDILLALPDILFSAQGLFAQTGGNHAAALFDQAGNLLALREDVGRHNALDKLLGWAFSEGFLPLLDHILLVSGRASFELVQKAGMAGIGLMAAVGAPSSLAVELATELGMTLVGFLKQNGFNLYCGERITYSQHS